MHNLANRVKVTKIEALDDDSGNYALYVDNGGVTFNTSTTTCISTMPWHTGSTDKVKERADLHTAIRMEKNHSSSLVSSLHLTVCGSF